MLLIIDNYDSFTYNLYQYALEFCSNIVVYRNDKISIAEIKELNPDGIIISPGPGNPYDAGICMDIIKQFSGIIPILGVCLGHQAIAATFGAEVVKAKNIMHGKSSLVSHNSSILYKNIKKDFTAGRYHSLIVKKDSLPEILDITALTKDDEIMGIQHRDHQTYGVQFHPESILSVDGKEIIKNFVNLSLEKTAC